MSITGSKAAAAGRNPRAFGGSTAEVVICGGGIAGVAAAYFLAVRRGVSRVVLVDARAPLTLTSDKSVEAYRNWWPGPDDSMIRLMNRSIDLLEELALASGNRFHLNRRGYLFASEDQAGAAELRRTAERAARDGAGPLRVHSGAAADPPYQPASSTGYLDQPTGADLIIDQGLIRRHFPYLTPRTELVLHCRRAGWLSGQQLGMLLLEAARGRGVTLVTGKVASVMVRGGRVCGVRIEMRDGSMTIATPCFVNAAGPMLKQVAAMLDVELPVFSELHLKMSFADRLGAVPRDAPMLIWANSQKLAWTGEEQAMLAGPAETQWLLEEFPPGVHCRPEGGPRSQQLLASWSYHEQPVPEIFPLPELPHFAEVTLRGLTRMIPGLEPYLKQLPRPYIDGGYYTKTRENRPLSGPLATEGAYVLGALSGFGIMASCATADLLAAHITRGELPGYASAFQLSRYDDPAYKTRVDSWSDSAQL